jgi:transposase
MPHYYLGGDASKGYADFTILNAEKKIVEPNFQLDDTSSGHRSLFKLLRSFLDKHPDSVLYAALESTGGYENNWYECLKDFSNHLPLQVARLNPALVKADREAGLKRNKTDALSAWGIAAYQISHPEKINYEDDSYPILRKRWQLIQLLSKQRTQLIGQLDSLLYISMPELLVFCRDGYDDWLLQILKLYPTYEALRAAGVAGLKKLPYVGSKKAERLLKLIAPEHCIGGSDAISGQILQAVCEQILHLTNQIAAQKKLLEQNYEEAKAEIAILTSFKGIGIFSAVGLLLNILDIQRFPTVKHLASYFGLHPEIKLSGDGVWRVCMSKKGRAEPRAILFMVTLAAIGHNPLIKELYQKRLEQGMHKMAAIGVCMHKILRIVYGMLKHKAPFEPNIDRKNQAKARTEKPETPNDKKRRLQEFDDNAPISRRQNRKRKELQLALTETSKASGATAQPPTRVTGDWVALGALLESYPQGLDNATKKS